MSAKDIFLRPITASEGNECIKRIHYSHSYCRNSQVHIGVFYQGVLEGALQFGPSLDRRKILGLVTGTKWNEVLELNRLAFSDNLPRNSESRAISISLKMLKKHAPQLKWILSFADGTQCGDGTIYRASGFVLTGIKKNTTIWEMDGEKFTNLSYRLGAGVAQRVNRATGKSSEVKTGASTMRHVTAAGGKPMPGFQLRYIYFLDPAYRARLSVPEIPFSAIAEAGAKMYKGKRGGSIDSDATGPQSVEGGASPTPPLQTET